MFLEQAVFSAIDVDKPLTVLDLCAAPGGKSSHLLSLLHPDSLLVSNEVIRSRASILSENIQKWGYPNVVITNNDPAHFANMKGVFDLIVVDAPCSGEGLFRKDNEALKEWSLSNVELCALRQQRILKDVWPALKQDGILIFSTCTYNAKEDEETMAWLSQTGDCEFISIPLDPDWGIVETKLKQTIGYRCYPHKVKGEGFFISIVRKREQQQETNLHTKHFLGDKSNNDEISEWLKDPAEFKFVSIGGLICAIPVHHFELINKLSDRLNIVHSGIPLASDKHGKLVPDHAGALSIQLRQDNFNHVALNLNQAIQYLRKETMEIDLKEKGFVLVSYEGNPLGWVNSLSNRTNNLYPSNWRIRMSPTRI